MQRKYFSTTRVAGLQYHEGLFCYNELKVGTLLTMRRDMDNRYDPDAVALYYKDNLIGYIPRADNKPYAVLLEQGWTDLFDIHISRIDEDAHPEHQIEVTIYVKENNQI